MVEPRLGPSLTAVDGYHQRLVITSPHLVLLRYCCVSLPWNTENRRACNPECTNAKQYCTHQAQAAALRTKAPAPVRSVTLCVFVVAVTPKPTRLAPPITPDRSSTMQSHTRQDRTGQDKTGQGQDKKAQTGDNGSQYKKKEYLEVLR